MQPSQPVQPSQPIEPSIPPVLRYATCLASAITHCQENRPYCRSQQPIGPFCHLPIIITPVRSTVHISLAVATWKEKGSWQYREFDTKNEMRKRKTSQERFLISVRLKKIRLMLCDAMLMPYNNHRTTTEKTTSPRKQQFQHVNDLIYPKENPFSSSPSSTLT